MNHKLFIISDIHGHFELTKQNLILNYYGESNDNHLLIVLGDIFDRGRESKKSMNGYID